MPKPKKAKEKSLKWYKNKCDKEFNALVTSRGVCEKCLSRVNQLHCSHTYPKGKYPSLRYDIVNCICLCAYCHRWFWHDNPIDAYLWFSKRFPDRYAYLQDVKDRYLPSRKKEDYERILKAVKERDVKSLITFPKG